MSTKSYIISTLGSHSALQILKGAKDEGFPTLLFAIKENAEFYKQFSFIDTIITLDSYKEVTTYPTMWNKKKLIIIPHGSFVAYLGEEGNRQLHIPYFGNKQVLTWEGNRHLQLQWFQEAGLRVPQLFTAKDHIDRSVIVKSYGAAGGKGYFVAHSQRDFEKKMKKYTEKDYIVQEYIIGVPIYLHFFYSPISHSMQLLSIDRRYETNVDALGRIPLVHQESTEIIPSFVVVGNSPLVLRESLLPEAYLMADKLVRSSQKLINKKGLFGPFCLETIVTPDQKFYLMEVSCRIVAGTNLFINGSPYASLYYEEPMSTGRRIAREIKEAIKQDKLNLLTT